MLTSTRSTSLLQDLLQSLPHIQPQIYFKASLTGLSHAMEDLVLDRPDRPLVIANFQHERFYRHEIHRYQQIAAHTDHLYLLTVPEPGAIALPTSYPTIGLEPSDELAQEWHLIIVGTHYCACLIAREYAAPLHTQALDAARQFQGFWTFDPIVCRLAAAQMLQQIQRFRPDLADRLNQATQQYQLNADIAPSQYSVISDMDARLFSERLIRYLQANQFKQIKAHGQVTQLNQKLATIERAQRNLVAIVGHELRTPLSTIQVCLESIATEPKMPKKCQHIMLDTALGDLDRLNRLIENFLLLSKLEGNLIHWHIESVDLNEAITTAVNRLQGFSKPQTRPTITIDLPIVPIILTCDGDALHQVLHNLLDNACKFTQKTGQITIKARFIEPTPNQSDNPTIAIQVSDTGCGIATDKLQTIFDRFYQAEGFLQRSVSGTGLGLTICQRLVDRLGGKLWATSAGIDRGSQFHIILPTNPHRPPNQDDLQRQISAIAP
jgi:signal transduction histidine kinase